MPAHHFERASPPDDGGHMGSYTTPAHLLLTAPEDTRSSESIGVEPFQKTATSSSLALFWAIVVVVELLIIGGALWS